ncbi:protein FANTASTIC FOUR 2 [Prunus yedoensis var. nudiflora]|uniref:Protein FANTASTIC FOUR 2 n=1 Tax=Prunus yedoensis var. nudiflora TaxID=2094558 RepID=A0A315ARH6_PRUYE|nr:protein FANTASTIC FOUR 2 [Prunus yedoensis var. nudiflora]
MSSTSSTVCHQGMKSCLEPLVRLKLAPPSSNFPSTLVGIASLTLKRPRKYPTLKKPSQPQTTT